jgi:hypothetical protein
MYIVGHSVAEALLCKHKILSPGEKIKKARTLAALFLYCVGQTEETNPFGKSLIESFFLPIGQCLPQSQPLIGWLTSREVKCVC